MSTQVCQDHSVLDTAVIYQGDRYTTCPMCAADQKITDLEQKVEDLEVLRDGLKDDISELKSQVSDLERRIE